MYAVIEIPLVALQAVQRWKKSQKRGSIAVLDETREKSIVCEVNAMAAREGVEVGMNPAQAQARSPEVQLIARSTVAEDNLGRVLLLLAQTLSPRVEHTNPGIATIDLRGVMMEGLRADAEALIDRFSVHGVKVRIGISITPEHARWSALFAKPILWVSSVEAFLRKIPLTVSGADEDLIEILLQYGVRSMADLVNIPRDDIGKRLGKRGIILWDTVSGRTPRLLNCIRPAARFVRKIALEDRLESLEALLFLLNRFLGELVLELESAQMAAYEMELVLQLENKTLQRQVISMPEPSGRQETLFRVLETALEQLRTQDAVIEVKLSLRVHPAQGNQGDLFAVTLKDTVAFAEIADRIAAIVGSERSGFPRLIDSWKPDHFCLEPLHGCGHSRASPLQKGDLRSSLPLSRFRPPRRIFLSLRDGYPDRVQGNHCSGIVREAVGPWRASGTWWSLSFWKREEWDIEIEGGELYRIFKESDDWFVEGAYG